MGRERPRDWEGAAKLLQARLEGGVPEVAVVLGSGLGQAVELEEEGEPLAFAELPGLPRPSVGGHRGLFRCGKLGGERVLVQAGRLHAYEGWSLAQVTLPVRILAAAGVKALVLTNAAGCLRAEWAPGEFMAIADHINLSARNPLTGPVARPGEERFVDLTQAWCPRWRAALRGRVEGLHEGVYIGVAGPSFETPAEIRAYRTLGADAVGMSTVAEAIVARAVDLRLLGISCLTNHAAGIGEGPLSEAEVNEMGARVRGSLHALVKEAVACRPRGA